MTLMTRGGWCDDCSSGENTVCRHIVIGILHLLLALHSKGASSVRTRMRSYFERQFQSVWDLRPCVRVLDARLPILLLLLLRPHPPHQPHPGLRDQEELLLSSLVPRFPDRGSGFSSFLFLSVNAVRLPLCLAVQSLALTLLSFLFS